ncbi:non-hydrolyzing UDP-N-acetylglucosamine 2-epimerase [Staphylococcus schweitzeri]|uniref:non-hydrolyzing UDP-N-acetylglucosamine 2-epimerase n=1 Tax=Staphylococcus schweitzeri TaxID=1654388 RepID=UPI000505EF3C|nr:UDP-N-acetylglucosamine 2-epimerase (non-hydrolyzing) [Staphylococcus schweitzeri]CDR22912.1 Capsular polysaccharide synthesis enzyme Cap8P [Staphylococcus schweitzeri]
MKKIMVIFGTRPEAIKMAPLVKEIDHNAQLEANIVITAQHRDMLDSVLNIFDIQADHDLNIMKDQQTLASLTANTLAKLDDIINIEKPDMILVHGDTTTTFVGSLAAFYHQIPVGHVEAGLRTHQKYSPFPEELNRVIVSNIAELNFAPTIIAAENLLAENKDKNSIFITGNTVIDALATTVRDDFVSKIINKHKGKKVILLTAHRRENIGEPMHRIFKAVRDLADEYEDVVFIYPMHRNPKVRAIAEQYLLNRNRIELIEPLDAIEFHNFTNQSYLVLTDSGGIQEEAPTFGKPVLVLRDHTERPEGVEAGTSKIIGTDYDNIFQNVKQLIENDEVYRRMSQANNPYGDGQASRRICEAIEYYFGLRSKKPDEFIPLKNE